MDQLGELAKTGRSAETVTRVTTLPQQGVKAEDMMSQALIPAMDEVGDLFQKGEYFVPEMLVAARAMQQGLEVLKPHMKPGRTSSDRIQLRVATMPVKWRHNHKLGTRQKL